MGDTKRSREEKGKNKQRHWRRAEIRAALAAREGESEPLFEDLAVEEDDLDEALADLEDEELDDLYDRVREDAGPQGTGVDAED